MTEEQITKGVRTQTEIIQAAYQLFIAHGFHATSMRQIAKQAGIALGSIYNHFTGKEDIFQAVLLTYHPYHEILPALETAQGETVVEFVRDAATRLVTSLNNRPDFLNLMFIEFVEFRGVHLPALLQSVLPRVGLFAERLTLARRELRPIPYPILLRSFLGLFFSYHITELFLGNRPIADMQFGNLNDFVEIYLHGILMEDPNSGSKEAL